MSVWQVASKLYMGDTDYWIGLKKVNNPNGDPCEFSLYYDFASSRRRAAIARQRACLCMRLRP